MNQQDQMNKPVAGWRKLLAKRWMYPVLYLAVAGLMLSVMWVYQNNMVQDQQLSTDTLPSSAPVNGQLADDTSLSERNQAQSAETKPQPMIQPYRADEAIQVVLPFYDAGAPAATREKALIEYNRTYVPHAGIDYAHKDQQTFDVLSALDGTVTRVEQHPLLGNVIDITHEDGLVTLYQSLAAVQVKLNQSVKQGEVIGQAGRNEFEKDLGVHLHFEIRQNQQAQNPQRWLSAKQ